MGTIQKERALQNELDRTLEEYGEVGARIRLVKRIRQLAENAAEDYLHDGESQRTGGKEKQLEVVGGTYFVRTKEIAGRKKITAIFITYETDKNSLAGIIRNKMQ